jgi:DNA-binding MarR family transcriptional regulator
MPSDELARDLRLAIGRIARRLRRLYVDADEGTSFLELAVLQRLHRDGPASPGTLAGDEGVTSAAVAAALTRLSSKELLAREPSPQDGRRAVVTITAAGRATLARRESASVNRIDEVLSGQLSDVERSRLSAVIPLLERIANEL